MHDEGTGTRPVLTEAEAAKLKIDVMTATPDWVHYRNGNYDVHLNLKDGTKIRFTEDDEFHAAFPESMDVKISNRCDVGCVMCHEDSRPDGDQAIIPQAFLDTLHPYEEIAVGGGNVLTHPQLEEFLGILRDKKCVASMTLNQRHFMESFDYVCSLYEQGLVYGIGVSLTDPRQDGFIERVQQLPTAVLHTIVGLLSEGDVSALEGNGLKLLLLGYKDIRRGHVYLNSSDGVSRSISSNTAWLGENLDRMMKGFKVLSFDNLALEQLPVRKKLGEEAWDRFYMGDDGQHTFYIDMVEQEFARSSTSLVRYPIADNTIDSMFSVILGENDTK